MMSNPEFTRNLWQEFTPHRLISQPLLIGIVLLLAYLVNDQHLNQATAQVAGVVYCVVVLLRGTYAAADSVVYEINTKTWDSQRMSALGPWQLALGKLFGSTAYHWYGGLIALAVFAASLYGSASHWSLLKLLVLYLGCGVIAHAAALLASLAAIQKRRDLGRFQIIIYLLIGLGAAQFLLPPIFGARVFERIVPLSVTWYDIDFSLLDFRLFVLALSLGWLFVGLYALIRVELQMPNRPWLWLGFVLFVAAFAGGFFRVLPQRWPGVQSMPFSGLLIGGLVLLGIGYVIAYVEPKARPQFRRLHRSVARGDWVEAVVLLPRATITAVAIFAWTIALTGLVPREDAARLTPFIIAIFLFYIRDMLFILWMNLQHATRRADIAALIYLLVSYTFLPMILHFVGLDHLRALFWPVWRESFLVAIAPPLLEVVFLALVVTYQWRRRIIGDEIDGPSITADVTP